MAKREQFSQTTVERQNRYFSESFKKQKVSEIDRKLVTISELSREYQVSSVSIYKWIYKYSTMRKKGEKLVYETESDTRKIKELYQFCIILTKNIFYFIWIII